MLASQTLVITTEPRLNYLTKIEIEKGLHITNESKFYGERIFAG